MLGCCFSSARNAELVRSIGADHVIDYTSTDFTQGEERYERILDNVVFLMIPSFNPDGQIMVVDWYEQNLGTDFEEAGMPWLYHHYAGHDNNRDGLQMSARLTQELGRRLLGLLDVLGEVHEGPWPNTPPPRRRLWR